MSKKKKIDNSTGIGEIRPVQESDWNQSGYSKMNLEFYAILRSAATYETEDDNYANFSGHYEITPKFSSMSKLMNFLNENKIYIGSKIKKVVPINNWEEKPYNRTVWMPITSIDFMAEYYVESGVKMLVSHEDGEGVTNNPKFDGNEKKLKVSLHNTFLHTLYSRVLSERTRLNTNRVIKLNIDEIAQLVKILGIEKNKKEQCNTTSEGKK